MGNSVRRALLRALCPLCVCAFLTGCALLERQYVTVEPHSGKFWESEAAGTLRAENYQDIVNDLLLLIAQHRENATLRLYHFDDDVTISDRLEQATVEIQQQTPLGSYAVAYIASVSQAQRGYHEIKLQIGYRRTAEELRNIVNATSPEAVYMLLRGATERNQKELAVRIGYWGPGGQAQVDEAKARLREDEGLTDFPDWPETFYYPEQGPVGLLEFRLDLPDTSESLSGDTPEGKTDTPDAPESGIDMPEAQTNRPDTSENSMPDTPEGVTNTTEGAPDSLSGTLPEAETAASVE